MVKATERASGEFCDRFSRVRAERIACSEKGHGDQSKGRSKLADAVKHLLTVVAFVFGIGAFAAEAAVRGARVLAANL